MRESGVESHLRIRCNEAGFACWKFNRPGQRNAFDRIVPLLHGRVVWIETKRSLETLNEGQQREKKFLESIGHVALCVNSTAAVEQFIETYLI